LPTSQQGSGSTFVKTSASDLQIRIIENGLEAEGCGSWLEAGGWKLETGCSANRATAI
jgi:hypothetical protein